MPRILVVSRNPAMAMGLSATAHDIIDLKPPTFGEWISGPDDVDAFVLDLESPTLAAAAIVNLRAHGKSSPALLVSNDRAGWDHADLTDLASAQVLAQPVTRAALLAALDEMLAGRSGEGAAEPFIAPEGPPDDLAPLHTAEALSELLRDDDGGAATPADEELELLVGENHLLPTAGSPTSTPAPSVDGDGTAKVQKPVPPQEPIPPVRREATPSRRRRPAPPKPRQPEAEEQPKLSAVPRTRRSATPPSQPTRATSSQVLDDLDQLRSPAKAPTTPARPRHAATKNKRRAPRAGARAKEQGPGQLIVSDAPERSPNAAVDLVRSLAPLVTELFSVPETASVIVTDAVEKCHADAGVLMVPDADSWRVSAGVHLRPLEYRIELDSESWLVCELVQRNRGAIIEDSDIVRERLQGVPLASWRHLLAVPVPEVHALLMVARRDDPPFDEDALALLAGLGAEAGSLLRAALDTRELARQLSDFTDEGPKSF